MQSSIQDDIKHYYLPIGVLGLINQLANAYIYIVLITRHRPLWPGRRIHHQGYSAALSFVTMVFVLGFDSTSASRLSQWELIASVVGNLILFLSFIGMTAASVSDNEANATPVKAVPSLPSEADNTLRDVTVHEDQPPPPPPYSKDDPNKVETTICDEPRASSRRIPCAPKDEASAPLDDPISTMHAKDADALGALCGHAAVQDDVHDPSSVIQAFTPNDAETLAKVRASKASDTKVILFYLIFNVPGLVLVFAGLVGQLAHNLPAGWESHPSHIRDIVIAFNVLLAATLLSTSVWCYRMRQDKATLNNTESKETKRFGRVDCFMFSVIALDFCIVSFDQWLLAALADDITGARHILSDGGMPLVYALITKLPVLAL
ncbi:hypothetical protein F4808DRAFT_409661 [Astrocystis sublimbata]|nr:hypothetical protein F4808DRAFT_409661 [Astrocystis sublimbata]